ncbi:dephospho-CoA kinase [Flavobacterium cerinum]|uniref:Dephospho-CoA kinase n=1 Tax=Flavobacterium cerinum TaxID=2502784 RepID=A0A444H6T0_9FLAO|nr:dephospho-CoA kinase [Flavobacterium cerinum]
MTKIIGLTGGIGSGKTTIAQYFKSQGVPLYIADDEAKKILNTPNAVKDIVNAFGESVLTGGLPDRAKIAALVFNSPDKLQILNSIIHPKVLEHFKEWLEKQKDTKFIIKEAAILFESGSYKDCDKIILVTAPKEVRVDRVMQRDGVTREKVLERMNAQWEDEKKTKLSDYIINNIDLENAKKEALKILNTLKKILN